MTKDTEDLALALRILRFLHDWSRGDLERKSGVDRKRIYEYEKGRRKPSPPVLARLAAPFKVTLAEVKPLIPALRELIHREQEDAPAPKLEAESVDDRFVRSLTEAVEAALPRILAAHDACSAPPSPLPDLCRRLHAASEKVVDEERAAKLACLARRLAERGY